MKFSAEESVDYQQKLTQNEITEKAFTKLENKSKTFQADSSFEKCFDYVSSKDKKRKLYRYRLMP